MGHIPITERKERKTSKKWQGKGGETRKATNVIYYHIAIIK